MNKETQRLLIVLGMLALFAFGITFVGRQLSGMGKAESSGPPPVDPIVEGLKAQVAEAKERLHSAMTDCESRQVATKQAVHNIQMTEQEFRNELDDHNFREMLLHVKEDVHFDSVSYQEQVLKIGIDPGPDRTAGAVQGQEESNIIADHRSKQHMDELEIQYRSKVESFQMALNDLKNAERAVNNAKIDVEQKQRELDIQIGVSLSKKRP